VTVFPGLVAASLVVGITATFLLANRDDEVVGFTLPHDLQTAQRAASIAAPVGPLVGIAPQPNVQQTFDDVIAKRVLLSYERFDAGPWITSIGHHVDPQAVRVSNFPEPV
jgi:hypothetical protein